MHMHGAVTLLETFSARTRAAQNSSILFYARKKTTVKIDLDVLHKECIFTAIQSSRNNNTEKLILIKSFMVLRHRSLNKV